MKRLICVLLILGCVLAFGCNLNSDNPPECPDKRVEGILALPDIYVNPPKDFVVPDNAIIAEPMYGVIAEERIINLPNDQAKWYVSVVGNSSDVNYQKVISWFNTDAKLKKLKDQVHFCPVAKGTAIYDSRYAKNVTELPTIRVQRADGEVIYEAYGNNIPMSADGLNNAIAEQVMPWRKRMEDKCGPRPCPSPNPNPSPPVDPEPQPIIDGEVPDMDVPPRRGKPTVIVVLLLIASTVIGGITGLAVEWSKSRRK